MALGRVAAFAHFECHTHVGDSLANFQQLFLGHVPSSGHVDPLGDVCRIRRHHDELAVSRRIDDVHVLRRALVVGAATLGNRAVALSRRYQSETAVALVLRVPRRCRIELVGRVVLRLELRIVHRQLLAGDVHGELF